MFDIFDETPTLEWAKWAKAKRLLDAVVPKRSTLPILQCVHVKGDSRTLTITGTDLDIAAVVTVPNDRGFVGEGVFDWKAFSGKVIPIAQIGHLPACEYPVIPEAEGDDVGVDWIEGAKACIPWVCTDHTRLSLNGVFVDKGGCTATDGHRLRHVEGSHNADMILPPKYLKLLDDGCTGAKATERSISALYPWGRVVSKVIEGPYPNWRQVVPKMDSNCPSVTLDRALFREACFAATKVSKTPKVKIEDGFVSIKADEGGWVAKGKAEGTIPTFGFNAAYMLKFCEAETGDKITLHQMDPMRPILINKDKPGIRILMPLRMESM